MWQFGVAMQCEVRFLSSLASAAVAAAIAGCILKLAMCLLGSAALAATVHLVFLGVPSLHTAIDGPEMAGLSLVYWISMAAAVVVGGLLA